MPSLKHFILFNVVLLGIISSAFASLSFVTEPVDQVVAVGQSMILNCEARDSHGRSFGINWKKNNAWLLDPIGKPWQLLRNNSLYYQFITAQDVGTFLCAATVSGTSEIKYSRTAKVQLAYTDAQFSSPPLNHTNRVDDSSTYFTCITGDSLPSASVYWEKDGQKITTGTVQNTLIDSGKQGIKWTSSSLLIHNLDLTKAGFYRCVAVNPLVPRLLRKSQAAYLKVLPKIDKPHFQVHPSNLVAAEGRPAILQCLILGVPKPQVSWTFNGHPLTNTPTRQTLSNGSLYFSVVNKTFAGQYKCKGSNTAGSVESSPVLFSVAFFGFQFFEHPKSQNVTMGTEVTLDCRPPSSYPVNIQINWFKNYQQVQAGPGISITSSGSMVFSAIKKSDEGEYFCNGVNPVLHESRTSNLAYVTVWVPPTFTIRPQDTAVIQYQPLLLHCESTGFPTPSLTWLKDGSAADTSHVNVLANGSLSINRTSVRDAGEYSCVADNVGGSAAVKANVVIYVPPSVAVYPSDATCVLGHPITFKCNFTGIPSPRVEWYHDNGTTLRPVPTTPKYNRAGYTLTVTSVRVEDKGTFVCEGINVAGSVNASAFLNVQVPVSLDTGPVNITVNQSSPASFQCIASGDPIPNITWYKEGTLLQNDGHVIITGDTLSIPRTTLNDAGQYQCHVTNGLATHVGKAHLVIQARPVITSFIVPTFARLSGNTSLTCKSTGIPNAQVTWYRNGEVVFSGSRVFLSDDGSLSIVGVVTSDGGVYTCVTSNAAGMTSRKGNLTVQVAPSPPILLSAIPVSSTSLQFSWQPGFNGHTPITGYKVDIKRESQSLFRELEANIDRLQLVVSNLVPYTVYTLRVSGRNVIGLGQAAEVSNRTLEDAPSKPTNISITTLNASVIQVFWSAPSQPNGKITWYEVVYQSLPSGSVLQKVFPADDSSLLAVLSSLQPFTNYTVKIRAATGRTSKKWGNYSTAVVKRTAEAAPDESPRDVQCNSFNSTALLVSWKPVPIGSANGDVKEYRILYQATGPYIFSDVTTVTVDGKSRSITIGSLHPWTYYNISVQAVTVSAGPGSDWKTVRTDEAAPSGPPTIVVSFVNETSIFLNITAPLRHMRNGHITGYRVYYKKSQSSSPFSQLLTSSSTALIVNLTVFTEYDVTAAAVTKAGTGIQSNEIKAKTGEGVPEAVDDVTEVTVTHSQIQITWQPPKPETGLIIEYTVHFNTTSGATITMTTTVPSITLINLSHNTTYHIWVIARTKKGYGPIGRVIRIQTRDPPLQTTGSPSISTTPRANNSKPTVTSTEQQTDAFLSLNRRDFIIVIACAAAVVLVLLIFIIYLACVRSRTNHGFSDTIKTRKLGRGLDVHELRGVSPDRRPVLDVQEETSVDGSCDDYSDWNSSITGVASEQVIDPVPFKVSTPIIEFPEEPETQAAEVPVTSPPPPTQAEPDSLANPVIPSYESFKNSPVARIRNKKLSLGSNDSYYDQPYSSVDELGTGFSSFTPPPPPDFRNDEPRSVNSSPSADVPKEFSNKLYNAVLSQPQPELQLPSNPDFSEPGYAEPEVKTRHKPETEVRSLDETEPENNGYAEPEVVSPPPPYFTSDYDGIENEGYDTDEELDKYLAEKEETKPKKSKEQQPASVKAQSPTSSRSQSVSPPSQGSEDTDRPEVVYAKPDLSKKKKNRKSTSPSGELKKSDYDAVVVYDERTNL